jgi:hypothetical protein
MRYLYENRRDDGKVDLIIFNEKKENSLDLFCLNNRNFNFSNDFISRILPPLQGYKLNGLLECDDFLIIWDKKVL